MPKASGTRGAGSLVPALAVGAELLDELRSADLDGVATGLEELAGIVALALLVEALLDVLARGGSKGQLEVGVDVDRGGRAEDRPSWP